MGFFLAHKRCSLCAHICSCPANSLVNIADLHPAHSHQYAAMDQAKRGDDALSANKYDEAIQHYTDAIAVNSTAVTYYIKRSTAYQRAKRYPEALADAEIATALAHKRGKRELIKEAQFRRGLVCFFLEQYANSEYLLGIVKGYDDQTDPKKKDATDKMRPIWEVKVAAKLKDIPEDDKRRVVTALAIPAVDAPAVASKPAKAEASQEDTPAQISAPKAVAPTPANKIKHDWYQNAENVTVSILAKGAPKDDVTVEFARDSVEVAFPVHGSGSTYAFSLDPSWASIDPAQSSYRVTPNKVELTLKKATPGVKWHNLEGQQPVQTKDEADSEPMTKIPTHVLTHKKPSMETPPAYPTSSKSGPKNWDTVADKELDDNDVEGDETSAFFKKLYSGATSEQQKAMMKSYQESGGTVLSTDWSNVGGRTVVPEPPSGMEAKKY
jgi:suppressor of G2 allele of SKP1